MDWEREHLSSSIHTEINVTCDSVSLTWFCDRKSVVFLTKVHLVLVIRIFQNVKMVFSTYKLCFGFPFVRPSFRQFTWFLCLRRFSAAEALFFLSLSVDSSFQFAQLSVCLLVCLSVGPFVSLSVRPSVCLSVSLSVRQPVSLSVWLFVCLSFYRRHTFSAG